MAINLGPQALALVCAATAAESPAEKLVTAGSAFVILMAALLLLLCVKAGFIAMALWMDSAWPRLVDRTVSHYARRPWRCVILGAINTIVGTLLALALLNGPAALVSGAVALLLLVLAALGYTAAYRGMARRVRPEERDTPGTLLIGGVALEALFFFPVLGQLWSAGVLLRGLGAASLAMLTRREPVAQDELDTPE
jgi:hypothetical protein